ncbi:MAG TPA: hypothetical protein VHY75_02095 [Steroidobacteraceae bacterium]|jgi:hypothetical protein|nr:hypothetical protein [Steroidobacteraceae bacterium]
MRIIRKVPKGLGRHEPLCHADHPRPTTRRQFIAQGFMTGSASVLLPSIFSLMANPKVAQAQPALVGDIQGAVTSCGISAGSGMIPFICFDLSGGANIAGSNVLVGGPGGQLDFLSVAGYSKLGLPGSMVPNSSANSFVDASLGLRYHSDSAHLRGIKTRFTSAAAMANVTGTIIPALSQNDTNTNPHNPMYGIWQAGARGALLDLIGTDSSVSGGNSMAPPGMINIAAQPTKISRGSDTAGLVSTGQLSTLLPNPPNPETTTTDVTLVLESMKRISDAKLATMTGSAAAYANSIPNGSALQTTAIQAQMCAYTKAAYLLNRYPSPGAVDPDNDPDVVGTNGIFKTAEYQASSDFQSTAAVMKLVIDGDAAAGTIQLGGFDYHTGDRATGETRDFAAGQCIGAVLQYAALRGKPVMIYVFSDGSLASDGTIDSSVAGRGKGVWTADNQNVAATYFLVYDPKAKPIPAQTPEMSLQLGYFNPDGSQNTTSSPAGNNVPNLVQMVVLNYMALHSTSAASLWPNLWPNTPTNNTLGATAQVLDPLIMYNPLASLVNGKVPG